MPNKSWKMTAKSFENKAKMIEKRMNKFIYLFAKGWFCENYTTTIMKP